MAAEGWRPANQKTNKDSGLACADARGSIAVEWESQALRDILVLVTESFTSALPPFFPRALHMHR